jgi:hypothetical protein
MPVSTTTPRRAPLVAALALLAVLVALVVVQFTVIRPDRNHAHKVVGGLTATEQSAVAAATQQVKNMLTYSRASFDSDYARTEAGASGALLSDLQSKKSTLQQQMVSSKFDLSGTITASAFEEVDGSNELVLVSAQGYTLPDGGTKTLQTTARFELTMTRTGGRWLASNLSSVGLV